MSKENLKLEILQKMLDENDPKLDAMLDVLGMSIEELREHLALIDTHLHVNKADGGEHTEENTTLETPVIHMNKHGNLRMRTPELEHLKSLIDERNQIMNLEQKMNNQLLAVERRTDKLNQGFIDALNASKSEWKLRLGRSTRAITKAVKAMDDPLAHAALSVHGVGPVTVAYCLVYLDPCGVFAKEKFDTAKQKWVPHPRAGEQKAPHASSLWKYVGLHVPSHQRYTKGEAGGGNKRLRTILHNFADSQVKLRGPYREVYDRVKAKRAQSEKLINGGGEATRNTQGKLVESTWKDAKPSHRDGDAQRQMVKHFLADYWYVARTLAGLPAGPAYAEAQLGGNHRTVRPDERGWIYEAPAQEEKVAAVG